MHYPRVSSTTANQDIILPDEHATVNFAARLAAISPVQVWYYFSGCLGAGKSCLVRAYLQAFGVQGAIRSPTFTLVEYYQTADKIFYHLDCYRLEAPQELIDIGLRDLFAEQAHVLIEWPEKGQGVLPPPDIHFHLLVDGEQRRLKMEALTARGTAIVQRLGNGE